MFGTKEEIIQKYNLFWCHFGLTNQIFFKNLKVLEIGCGKGEMCLDMSFRGASQVVGIDISPKAIKTAQETLLINYPSR